MSIEERNESFTEYIKELILDKDSVEETVLANAVVKYGKSNTTILNRMLNEVEKYLFECFFDSLISFPSPMPMCDDFDEVHPDDRGYPLDALLKEMESFPYFQTLETEEQEGRLWHAKICLEGQFFSRSSIEREYEDKYDIRLWLMTKSIISEEIKHLDKPHSKKEYSEIPDKDTIKNSPQNANSTISSSHPEKSDDSDNINKGELYNFDINKIMEIYEFCIENKVFNASITQSIFIEAVHKANFRDIYWTEHTIKCRLKYIIYVTSTIAYDNWYYNAVESINSAKTQCSGANIPDDFKKKAQKLIKKLTSKEQV